MTPFEIASLILLILSAFGAIVAFLVSATVGALWYLSRQRDTELHAHVGVVTTKVQALETSHEGLKAQTVAHGDSMERLTESLDKLRDKLDDFLKGR